MESRSFLFKLSLALYAVSLPLPVVSGLEEGSSVPGFACLLMVPFIPLYPAWWANPLYFAAARFLKNGYPAESRFCSVVAVLFAATIALGADLKPAAFLWFASLVTMVAASFSQGLGYRPEARQTSHG